MTLRLGRQRLTLDADTLARLYRLHAQRMVVYFARRIFDAETAVDLTAETFAQAFRDRRQFRGRGEEEAVGWIWGIARHQLAAYYKRGHAERRALAKVGVELDGILDEEIERIEELAGIAKLRERVARELHMLSADHREAVRLKVIEDWSYREMAEHLGLTEQTIRARVSRGLRALALALEADLVFAEEPAA